MKAIFKYIIFSLLIMNTAFAQNSQIKIETELGSMVVELYDQDAPVTVSNFLKYVDQNMWKGASFYRVVTMENQPDKDVKIEVVQGGLGWSDSLRRLEPIEHESTEVTGIKHKNGVISMARSAPGSADAEFFICVGDQPSLDFGGKRNPDGQGFAAFGIIREGFDTLEKIYSSGEQSQMLGSPILIRSITRVQH